MKYLWLFLSLTLLGLLSFLIFFKNIQEEEEKGRVTIKELSLNYTSKESYTRNLLLIGMLVRGTSFSLRNIIRETLMKLKYFQREQVKFVFVMALPPKSQQYILPDILKEIETYQDIFFISDLIDGWKQVGMKYKRFLQYAAQTDYLFSMKLDDDAYIFLEYLVDFLETLVFKGKSNDFYYMGKIKKADQPKRHLRSKYYVSWKDYPRHIFPIYAAGYGSVHSNSLLRELFSKTYTNYVFFMEDIMIATWIEEYLKRGNKKPVHFIGLEDYGIEMQNYASKKVKRPKNKFYNLIHHIQEDQLHCLYQCDVEDLSFISKYKCIGEVNV